MRCGGGNHLQGPLIGVLASENNLELTLSDSGGQIVGIMRPLTSRSLKQDDVIQKLTQWRNANMHNFLTRFEATPERTRNWIKKTLLANGNQMLWLIYDQHEALIGHFGFKNLTSQSVLLDNAIRGERRGHPKLLVFAGRSLVKWLFQTTSVQRIDGYVMADNVPAIMMNREIGFHKWNRRSLTSKTVYGETHWMLEEEKQKDNFGLHCFVISIERTAAP